jgi:serine/threonine-protein kinase HipA
MKLAEAAGVHIAEYELMPSSAAVDIPSSLLPGPTILAVKRFDRLPGGRRIHGEDYAQILGAVGDQKYARGNEETVVNIAKRFSADGQLAVQESVRRIVVNYLLGNTDAHLKNWSLIFPKGAEIRLAPAYDIVSMPLVNPRDNVMALKLRGSNDPKLASGEKFQQFAAYVGLTPTQMTRIVRGTVAAAAAAWPQISRNIPWTQRQRAGLGEWWRSLPITQGTPSPF